jgi:hypothetical protein
MPKDDPSPTNGNTPKLKLPVELHFERGPVKCQRCRREFAYFVIEEIDDLAQLRCGDVLIAQTKMICMHCGWTFYWDVNGKKLETMAIAYGEVVRKMTGYRPE